VATPTTSCWWALLHDTTRTDTTFEPMVARLKQSPT
jgi:hypothetical protein